MQRNKTNSQSTIEKNYFVLNAGINRGIKDKLLSEDFNPMADIDDDTILRKLKKLYLLPLKKQISFLNISMKIKISYLMNLLLLLMQFL